MKGIIPFLLIFILLYASEVQAENATYSYEMMLNEINELASAYTKNIKIGSIGKSEWGNEIPYIQIGEGKNCIFLIGSHHGREWITSLFLMKLVNEYANLYIEGSMIGEYSPTLLDEYSLIIIPMLNPDGVTIQQNGMKSVDFADKLTLWKLNNYSFVFKRWKANALGVDLNRQYPAGWDKLNKKPSKPFYKHYRGIKPIQAAEVKALVQFTNKLKPKLAVAYHTTGREVYWFYQNKSDHIPRDYDLAAKISHMTGYTLALPERDAIGGGYTDWFITHFRLPAFTIEMCKLVEETNPPLSCLNKEWRANKNVPIMLIDELMKNKKQEILRKDLDK